MPVKKIFYQSSMPRSGSTLLQNILGQNPKFYVTPTSGVLELIYGARMNYTNNPEFKAQDPDEMKKAFTAFCKGGIEAYFNTLTKKEYVVDKSRGWGHHYAWLNEIFPDPKIVCMVRDLRDVLCSMEKKYLANPDKHHPFVNHETGVGTTTESRMDVWVGSPPIGLALTRIKQMMRDGTDSKVLFIKFEDICLYPDQQMRKIYDHFGVDYFEHDFNKVKQITKEDDEVYGVFGDHEIREKVAPVYSTAKSVLGADICKWIQKTYEWYFDRFEYR